MPLPRADPDPVCQAVLTRPSRAPREGRRRLVCPGLSRSVAQTGGQGTAVPQGGGSLFLCLATRPPQETRRPRAAVPPPPAPALSSFTRTRATCSPKSALWIKHGRKKTAMRKGGRSPPPGPLFPWKGELCAHASLHGRPGARMCSGAGRTRCAWRGQTARACPFLPRLSQVPANPTPPAAAQAQALTCSPGTALSRPPAGDTPRPCSATYQP